jgi:hypothetical protein
MSKTTVAAVQMVSSPKVEENIDTARRLLAEAAGKGAKLVTLPEYWPIMGMADTDKVGHAEQPGHGIIQDFMAAQAREHGFWLIGGTLPLVSNEAGKVLNTTLVYDPEGRPVSRYDKIHLFGFTKGEESYDEARTIVPGEAVGSFEAPFGKVGLSVCYDLRFPELYRAMGEVRADRGAGRLYPHHRHGALGSAAARARHRKPVLRAGVGPGRHPPQRPPHLRPQHADRPLGRSAQPAARRRGRGLRRDRYRLFGRSPPEPARPEAPETVKKLDMAQCPIPIRKT